MAAPIIVRPTLFAIYAFNLEIARAPWLTSEAIIAEMRLQWWHDALEEIATGGSVRRHQVVTPLSTILSPTLARDLQRSVTARRWDVYNEPFCNDESFKIYIEETSSPVLAAAAHSLGAVEDEVISNFAYAMGLAKFFLAVPKLISAGRQPLLASHAEYLVEITKVGLDRLKEARDKRSSVSKKAGYAFLSGWETGSILRRAKSHPKEILTGLQLSYRPLSILGLSVRTFTGLW